MNCTRELFAAHDLRCTQQRMAIYDALCTSTDHPTAEVLYRRVRDQFDRLSLATVYNTLEALHRAGLIRKLPTTNGCCRYDASLNGHTHVRIAETGEIADLPEDLGRRLNASVSQHLLNEIERTLNVRIDSVEVLITARRTTGHQSNGQHTPGRCTCEPPQNGR